MGRRTASWSAPDELEFAQLGASCSNRNSPASRAVEDLAAPALDVRAGTGLIVNHGINGGLFASAIVLASALAVPGIAARADEPAHVTIEAFTEKPAVRPGQTFRVALVERIQPGWHTYWINPGDAGQATKLRWTLPPGYRVDEVQWPVPQVFRAGSIVSYGYEGQAVLLQTVHAPATLPAAPARLSVDVQWLACRDICIPEHGAAQITLNQEPSSAVQTLPVPAVFTEGSEHLPQPSPWPATLRVDKSTLELRVRGIAHDVPADAKVEFLPLSWGQIDNAAAQHATRAGADLILTIARGDLRAQPLAQLDGVLVVIEGHGAPRERGFVLQVHTSDPAATHTQS